MKEADNQIGALTQTRESVVGHTLHLFPVRRRRILHPCLHISMAILLWVDVRRTGWQPLNLNLWVLGQICRHLLASMDRRSIPYQYERPLNMPPQMFQCFDNRFPVDRLIEMAFVYPPRNCKPHGCRQNAAFIGHSSQHRRLPDWSPGVSEQFKKRKTDFIKKDYFSTDSPRFFLFAASHCEARLQPTHHLVQQHEEQVSEESSQVSSRIERGNSDDKIYRTAYR